MSLQRKGKSINWTRINYIISDTTKKKLSLGARNGITVKVIDKHNLVVNIFPTITSAAKYYHVDPWTLSKYIKEGYYLNNLRFEAEFKDLRVWVFDKECCIVDVFTTANKAANFCGIQHTILHRHLIFGKLLNNKYYFSITNSCM